MPTHPENHIAEVRPIRLTELRSVIRPERYQQSPTRALLAYAFDGSLYLAAIAGALLAPHWALKLLFGLLAGSAIAFMFVWAHDAAHGALFRSQRLSRWLGTLFMLPSFNMYRLWAHGHNRVHHGFTSLSSVDWIWRPWTPAEYEAKPRFQRLLYRLERSPYGCALHYLLRVWWPGMIRFRGDGKNRVLFRRDKWLTLAFFVGFSVLAYAVGGLWSWFAAVLLPFLVFNYYIALFVFLHHTHPDLPFFAEKEDWSPALGQLYCSTIVRCSRVSEMLIHNILIHTPHHVDPRIPYYHLHEAYADLAAHYGQYIHEMRFSLRGVWRIFRECQLYDYENRRWLRFRQRRAWLAEQQLPRSIVPLGEHAAP
jgi:omega-6 fatty acid desaturase (delta-12 desaturase)